MGRLLAMLLDAFTKGAPPRDAANQLVGGLKLNGHDPRPTVSQLKALPVENLLGLLAAEESQAQGAQKTNLTAAREKLSSQEGREWYAAFLAVL